MRCVLFYNVVEHSQIIPDVAVHAPVLNSISAEFRDIVANVRVTSGPHGRVTLRDRRGCVLHSFYSVEDAHAWVLSDCPNWRELFISTSSATDSVRQQPTLSISSFSAAD